MTLGHRSIKLALLFVTTHLLLSTATRAGDYRNVPVVETEQLVEADVQQQWLEGKSLRLTSLEASWRDYTLQYNYLYFSNGRVNSASFAGLPYQKTKQAICITLRARFCLEFLSDRRNHQAYLRRSTDNHIFKVSAIKHGDAFDTASRYRAHLAELDNQRTFVDLFGRVMRASAESEAQYYRDACLDNAKRGHGNASDC